MDKNSKIHLTIKNRIVDELVGADSSPCLRSRYEFKVQPQQAGGKMEQECIGIAEVIDCIGESEAILHHTFLELEKAVALETDPLKAYGIKLGPMVHATQVNFTSIAIRVTQNTSGHWLSYLHARRAGAFPPLYSTPSKIRKALKSHRKAN